jgi:hypothetical protein
MKIVSPYFVYTKKFQINGNAIVRVDPAFVNAENNKIPSFPRYINPRTNNRPRRMTEPAVFVMPYLEII